MDGIKHDEGKNRLDLIPVEIIEELGKVLTFGAEKYAEDNWKLLEDPEKRYYAALLRHLFAHQKGEIKDPETGLHHLSHALTNAAFLLYFKLKEKEKQENE